jgi:DNA-directed RNA polymerase I subunit RPA12
LCTAYENLSVQTYSNPAAFPSALRQKRALVVKAEDEEQEQALPVTQEACPKCGHVGLTYQDLQLRSVLVSFSVLELPLCSLTLLSVLS